MNLSLYSLIELSSRSGLDWQRSDGSMPAGHNGPYLQPEVPVRTTGNWLLVFLRASELTGDVRTRQAAEKAATYLLDPIHRPRGSAFVHLIRNHDRDGNGLIGQAWTLMALFEGFRVLGWDDLLRTADSVLRKHEFDPVLGLWRTLRVEGDSRGVNTTLNQQIWFTAAALLHPEPPPLLARRIQRFMQCLPDHVRLSRPGPFPHLIHPRSLWRRFPVGLRSYVRQWASQDSLVAQRPVGYHAFVLHGLAMLEASRPDDRLWADPSLTHALDYGESVRHRQELENNRFAYGYNPSGIEMAYALSRFRRGAPEGVGNWLSEQFRRSLDTRTGMMVRNTPDPTTLASRLCEAIRLPDVTAQIASGQG